MSISLGKVSKWFADLKTVAFTGSYNDLTDKPSVSTVGNGTITITQNGTTKGTFTTNQSDNTTIALTDNNTTYSTATQSVNGLMSSTDKAKLDAINTSTYGQVTRWICPTTVGAWSRVAKITASSYGNILFSVIFSQNAQAVSSMFSIGLGHMFASISQISNNNYTSHNDFQVRITLDSSSPTVFYIELYNSYGYNSATAVNAACTVLSNISCNNISIGTYTVYTATNSSDTVRSTLQTKADGITIPKIYSSFVGNLSGTSTYATQLATARTIQTNLGSASSVSFNGTTN